MARCLAAMTAALIVASTAVGQRMLARHELPADEQATADAQSFFQMSRKDRDTRKAIKKVVRELDWQSSLDAAQRAAEEQKKPIVWIQALGDLKGYT